MQKPLPHVRTELLVTYRVRADAARIEDRARTIAVEQSVEMPLDAIADLDIQREIVGTVHAIDPVNDGTYRVRIALAAATVGTEAGQLFNMLFGNTSIHDDVVLEDVDFPAEMTASFPGPNAGIDGLRARVGAPCRALTCSALKPQGLDPEQLADLAYRLALGGLDYVKDDHGLAEQSYSPFARRVAAVAAGVTRANRETGRTCLYAPSLSGSLDAMRRQTSAARSAGVSTLLIAPMIAGVDTFVTLVRENRDMAFLTHPALAGAARIAPALHFGKIFRLLGGDGLIFPNYGGRFAYSPDACRAIAASATADWPGVRAALPVPAGGMTLDRIAEILAFYGPDVMLLIGGGLLSAGPRLSLAAKSFVDAVESYDHDA